ncbi:MAG TPA: ATP-binding protein [Gemmataceae bacterium]|nr:ATP-binding protein [Gemmataceae bacterium]
MAATLDNRAILAAKVLSSAPRRPQGDRPALQIAIQDNGPGFTPEQRQRALEPFFTTKPKGTSLGLAIVRRLLNAALGERLKTALQTNWKPASSLRYANGIKGYYTWAMSK